MFCGSILVCPDEQLKSLLIRIGEKVTGLLPVVARNTNSAARAIYAPHQTKSIINVTSESLLEKLAYPVAGFALEVDDVVSAAQTAMNMLGGAGYHAECLYQAEPEFPKDFIVFMVIQKLPGIVILFWPKNPDPEMLKLIDPGKPWTRDMLTPLSGEVTGTAVAPQ